MSDTHGHSGNGHSGPGRGQGPRTSRTAGDRPPPRPPAQDRTRPAGPQAPTPTIVIDPDIARVVDESLAALRAAGAPLYQRSHQLVHVLFDGGKLRGITRPPGTPHIVPLSAARLRELMATTATWVRPRRGPTGEPEHVPALPPDWAVAALLGRGTWATIPYLEAVTECPVLRPDGSVLEAPGYDPTTGLLYQPSTAFPPVPPAPDATAAQAAVTQLLDVVCDFPFTSDAHRAAWLAGLLTPLARYAFRGPAPLLLIDANTRGAGKSLLTDVTAEILVGRPMARMPATENDAEERKRITALAQAGDPLVLIDNVAGVLGTPALDAALTGTEWSDRLLGTNTLARLPLVATWFATGNNVVLNGDTTRRALHVRLDAREENPETRTGFRHPDLLAWVRAHRGPLLVAALTVLRAYHRAGRPDMELVPWGSFEGWSRLVRHGLRWCGLPDPGKTRDELASTSDRDRATLAALLEGWSALHGEGTATVAQVLQTCEDPRTAHQADPLRRAIEELTGKPLDRVTARSLGMRLNHLRNRVLGGRALIRAGENAAGVLWQVRRTSAPGVDKTTRATPSVDGTSGTSGSSHHLRQHSMADQKKVQVELPTSTSSTSSTAAGPPIVEESPSITDDLAAPYPSQAPKPKPPWERP